VWRRSEVEMNKITFKEKVLGERSGCHA